MATTTSSRSDGADELDGGDGEDALIGGDGDDLVRGGADNDTIDDGGQASGADDSRGGEGLDLDRAPHQEGVTIRLNDLADDGATAKATTSTPTSSPS